jgi:hypothetical protein
MNRCRSVIATMSIGALAVAAAGADAQQSARVHPARETLPHRWAAPTYPALTRP